MTKSELIDAIATISGESQASSERVLDALTVQLRGTLAAGGSVALPGLGKFETTARAARKGRNPATGEVIDIPAGRGAKFRPAKALREAVAL